jgi:hypothetical protein
MMIEAKYRSLLWELIAAFDGGNYDFLTAEHVQSHARAHGISILLKSTFGATADFSFLSEDDWATLDNEVATMMAADDAPWPFIAKRKGLATLMAFALQGMEQDV